MTSPFKRLLVGKPIATSEEQHQRIGKPDRARGVRLGRHLVHGVRHRGDAPRPADGGGVPDAHNYLVPISIAAVILLVIVSASATCRRSTPTPTAAAPTW
jgi:hypothetical protein